MKKLILVAIVAAIAVSVAFAPYRVQDIFIYQFALQTYKPLADYLIVNTTEDGPNKETLLAVKILERTPVVVPLEYKRNTIDFQRALTGSNLDGTDYEYYYIERSTVLTEERQWSIEFLKNHMPSMYHDQIDHIYDEKEKPYYASPSSNGNKTHIEVLCIEPHVSKNSKRPTLLYLHGGGLTAGSIYSHQGLVAELAKRARLRACIPEYRLAPENPYPTMLEDTLDVYNWLRSSQSVREVIVSGDSAGGLLSLWLMIYLRDHGLQQVKGAYLISPTTDLSHDFPSNNATTDIFFRPGSRVMNVEQIYGLPFSDEQTSFQMGKSPKLSPFYADLSKLPSIYFQVGSYERLLDESTEFAKKAQEGKVTATATVYKFQQHVFQSWYHFIPEADQALKSFAVWCDMLTRFAAQPPPMNAQKLPPKPSLDPSSLPSFAMNNFIR